MNKLLLAAVCGAMLAMGCASAQTAPAPSASEAQGAPSLAMVRVYVRDMHRTERLLQETLGMRVVAEIDAREHVMMFPGQPAGPGLLILQANAENPERNGAIVVRVGDVEGILARAVALGATVVRPAQTGPQPGSSYAMFNDYDGTLIQITQYPESLRRPVQ